MSASEAARNFSAVLDATENGQTTVVTRSGRRVALIAPAPRANGGELLGLLARWRGHPALDGAFAAQIDAAREAASTERDSDPWRD
ncbi:MAG: type II toxin-antitoxin system Phd/YefM family antitoxin [Pseudonocardia sp.]